jgi:hypothetical protein
MQIMTGLWLTLLASRLATTIATQLIAQPAAAPTAPARSFAVEHVRVFDGLESMPIRPSWCGMGGSSPLKVKLLCLRGYNA